MLWIRFLALLQAAQPEASPPTVQWIPIIVAVVGGGAMGSIITALVTNYRNRSQPVGYTKEIVQVFKKNPDYSSLHAMLSTGDIKDDGVAVMVENLSIVRFTIINKGNQDIAEFKFGVTLGGSNEAIEVSKENPDRHHLIIVDTPVSLGSPKKEIDLTLKPFNRRNEYPFSVHFTYTDGPGSIELSSSHSTQFVKTEVRKNVWNSALGFLVLGGAIGAISFSILAGTIGTESPAFTFLGMFISAILGLLVFTYSRTKK